MKNILSILVLLFIASPAVKAQDAGIEKMLSDKQFVFNAERAIPQSLRVRQLSYGYTLAIKNDTLIADLPYFGIAHSAPIDRERAGIEFTSTNYTYSAAPGKKGRIVITLVPKDITADVRDMTLTIFPNGSAYLQVNSNLRQAISFDGSVAAINPGKKS